jgi:glycosyltransferase involved in cell wall biosynthesis
MSNTYNLKLKVLQVSALDHGGGAEQVSWNLFRSYRQASIPSRMMVGKKRSNDSDVYVIERSVHSGWWADICNGLGNLLNPLAGKVRGILRFQRLLCEMGKGKDWIADLRGEEDFYFPGSWSLVAQAPEKPSIVHFHNLHGGYFDPRALTKISKNIPVMLTLHDAWLLSGNCAHSFECERWKTGCGDCPDITIYPGLKVDSTHQNWKRKQSIFSNSQLYIATPCQWLLDKVNASILAPAVIEARVIPNGVDTHIFYPAKQEDVRTNLGLPLNEPILLFVANGIKTNIFKDYETLKKAIELLGASSEMPVHLIALGDDGNQEQIGNVTVHYVPRTTDPNLVAKYYQAADIYLHAAKAETFPNTILEAMACGIPVVASNVGGICEQVLDGVTGFLVPPKDPELMAIAALLLLNDAKLRRTMGEAASKRVQEQFTLNQQVENYLAWYEEILDSSI